MITDNPHTILQPRDALRGKWAIAIVTFLLYTMMTTILSYTFIGILLLGGPLSVGAAIYSLNVVRGREGRVEDLFEGFKNFGNALGTYLLMGIFVFLWALLCVIPGIVAALSYSMSMYIQADNPDMPSMDVLRKSKRMMDGYKLDLFVLHLEFFGLSLLCLLTCGIGYLWLLPYMHVSLAHFYEGVKARYDEPTVMQEINTIGSNE